MQSWLHLHLGRGFWLRRGGLLFANSCHPRRRCSNFGLLLVRAFHWGSGLGWGTRLRPNHRIALLNNWTHHWHFLWALLRGCNHAGFWSDITTLDACADSYRYPLSQTDLTWSSWGFASPVFSHDWHRCDGFIGLKQALRGRCIFSRITLWCSTCICTYMASARIKYQDKSSWMMVNKFNRF